MKAPLLALAVLTAVPAAAQIAPGAVSFQPVERDRDFRRYDTIWNFTYELGGAIGSFSQYISAVSPVGFNLEGRSKVTRRLSVGLTFGFNRYSQTSDLASLALDNGGTASGPLYRYAHFLSPRLTAHYYFLDQSVQPYVGVGLGAVWSFAYQRVADLEESDSGFHFASHAEAGLYWSLALSDSRLALTAAVRYTFTTVSFAQVQNAMMLSGLLGVAWQI
ncbi:MAG: acyloxyacyl hydrolase [Myxococcales bacterium]|nr:acyloxyacyl hydrolase [Myxococcales bacterium]